MESAPTKKRRKRLNEFEKDYNADDDQDDDEDIPLLYNNNNKYKLNKNKVILCDKTSYKSGKEQSDKISLALHESDEKQFYEAYKQLDTPLLSLYESHKDQLHKPLLSKYESDSDHLHKQLPAIDGLDNDKFDRILNGDTPILSFDESDELELMHEEVHDIENNTKAQLSPNKRCDIVCKVIYKKKLKRTKFGVVNIHILPNSTSTTSVLMDIIAKKNQVDRLINSLSVDKFYKIRNIKPYFDRLDFATVKICFDEQSRIQTFNVPTKFINRFNINWLLHKPQINDDYEEKRNYEFAVAGYVYSIPLKKLCCLHVMKIRNRNNQIITVNLWGKHLPNIVTKLKLNDIIILPKVTNNRPWTGRQCLNNNGPIYRENKLWPPINDKNESDLQIIDFSHCIKQAKSIYLFFFNNDIYFLKNKNFFVPFIYSNYD